MAGLVKAKKYDWKDSNLALFGTDLERNVSINIRIGEALYRSRLLFTGEESGCRDREGLGRSWAKSRTANMEDCEV